MSEPQLPEDTFTRVCRKCSTQSTTAGMFCPNCGKGFERGGSSRINRKAIIIGTLALVLIAATATGLVLKNRHDDQVEATRVASVEQADAERAAENQAEADETERTQRNDYVTQLEKNIEKDAKGHVKEGIFEGPILSASCTATGGGSADDLTALTGTFECIAVNKENKDGTMSGYSYDGTIDWKSSEFTWQLGG